MIILSQSAGIEICMNKLKYFDSHSHIQDKAFDADREAVLARMQEEGIGALVVGTDRKMSEDAVALAEKCDFLWATVGQHPADNPQEDFDREKYLALARHPKVVAIGECGLDYYHETQNAKRKTQNELFEKHIELALEVKKPLMLHCRSSAGTLDAYEEMLKILNLRLYGLTDFIDFKTFEYPGNVHFFVGDWPVAEQFLKRGFTLSFTGVVTFARDYDEVIKRVPLDRLLVETDCPYVAPVPYRGKRNEPKYVKEIAQKVAEIRGENLEKIIEAMLQNALRAFGLSVTM